MSINEDVLSGLFGGDDEGVSELLKSVVGNGQGGIQNVVPEDYEERVKAIISVILDKLAASVKEDTVDVAHVLTALEQLKRIR